MANGLEIDDDAPAEAADDIIVQSKKTEVIAILFDELIGTDTWPTTRRLVVDSDKLVEAIKERNRRHPGEKKPLSTKNPANFLKDFIRKTTCNTNWPNRLSNQRITARQVYGNMQVFEFIPFAAGDTLPFPDRFDPTPAIPTYAFESLSIPVEARKLGRHDEPWLIQVAVTQRLIETHLAIESARVGLKVQQLAHLQVSVKTQPEIDATFIATIQSNEDKRIRAYVTVEAKQISERILEHQIREQIKVAFSLTKPLIGDDKIDVVLPIVLKVVRKPGVVDLAERLRQYIYVAQFHMINRSDFDANYSSILHDLPLSLQSSALYEPHPPIAGISSRQKTQKTAKS